jgi:hypothetical protein
MTGDVMRRNIFIGELVTRAYPTRLFRYFDSFTFIEDDELDEFAQGTWYDRAFDGLFEFYQAYDFYETA